MLPSHCQEAHITPALKRIWGFALVVVTALTVGLAPAAGVNDQPIRLDGLELFFGIVPAEILRGHPSDHEERIMHGGVPRGKGVHHLIVSVFDAKTQSRIVDGMVTASVTEVGMATQSRTLEAMAFGGNVSYGNYFAMPNQGPYDIVVNVRQPSDGKAVTMRFPYWHPRR